MRKRPALYVGHCTGCGHPAPVPRRDAHECRHCGRPTVLQPTDAELVAAARAVLAELGKRRRSHERIASRWRTLPYAAEAARGHAAAVVDAVRDVQHECLRALGEAE